MVLERHRVSYCRFCENSVSKFLSGNNDGHLWAEFTHNKEVFEKASLQVSLRIVPYSACDSTISKTSHLRFLKWVLGNSPKKGWCNTVKWRRERWISVWWSHTSESNLSESFSLVAICWGYFLFHNGPQWAPKYPFSYSTKSLLANCFRRTKL